MSRPKFSLTKTNTNFINLPCSLFFHVPTVLWSKKPLEACEILSSKKKKRKAITFSYGSAWCSLFMFQADFFQSYQVLCQFTSPLIHCCVSTLQNGKRRKLLQIVPSLNDKLKKKI